MTVWQPGMTITAGRLNAVSPYHTGYTPTWDTSGGANTPALGNANVDCLYAVSGGLVVVNFNISFGSTTDFGAAPTSGDNWLFGLPVPTSVAGSTAIGFVEVANSNANRLGCLARTATDTQFELYISTGEVDGPAGGNGLVDSVTPWTWASGNSVKGTLMYPAA